MSETCQGFLVTPGGVYELNSHNSMCRTSKAITVAATGETIATARSGRAGAFARCCRWRSGSSPTGRRRGVAHVARVGS